MQIPLIVFIAFFALLYLKFVREWDIPWIIVLMPFWIGPVGLVVFILYAIISR